jgi:hypothetical protein
MLSNSRTESAAAGASTKENPRRKFATGSAGLASVVRGSSRRIMIMRFRPANISLINRRLYLPRLLLTLPSKRQEQKQPNDSQILTGSHHIIFRVGSDTSATQRFVCVLAAITGPQPRGTGGTLIRIGTGHRDRGHPPSRPMNAEIMPIESTISHFHRFRNLP